MKQDKTLRPTAHALKRTARALMLAGLAALPLSAMSQAATPFEAEGVVTGIYAHPDGSAVDLTVFGRVFRIPQAAAIHTPTATLTLGQLASPSRFPGRDKDGFLGGTAILVGEVVTLDGVATPLITSVEIEPAETVLLGTITRNEAGSMALLDVPLKQSTDVRLPSKGFHNQFGFAVNSATIPVGTFAAIEGYYAEDGNFYHFALEAGAGELADPTTPQSSILRARCDTGGRLEVQGASYLPATNTIDIYNAHTGFRFGSVSTAVDLEQPEFGTYRFRTNVNERAVDEDGACPSRVRAVTRTNPTTAFAPVDGITAPAEPPPAGEEPPPGGEEPPVVTNDPPVAVDDAATVFVNLATEVHLTVNDSDPDGNLDPSTVQLSNIPAGLAVVNLNNGDVMVTAAASGIYSFNYRVFDTAGAESNLATVTITADPVAMDTLDITRANYRLRPGRWDVRGTVNQPGQVVTVTVLRTGQIVGTATADATGAWSLDVRNSAASAVEGDIVRADSNGGGSGEMVVTITR